MKLCFKCLCEKPLDDFYRHQMMADGHLNKCKACTRRDAKANREANIERVLAYDRARSKAPERIASITSYRHLKPDRHKARVLLQAELRSGRMERWPCQICGNPKTDAHHPAYSLPLAVVWLCRKHHAQVHSLAA